MSEKRIESDIYEILARHFGGTCSDMEQKQINDWKENNAAEYNDLEGIWKQIGTLKDVRSIRTNEALGKVKTQIKKEDSIPQRKNSLYLLKIAASVLILVVAGAIVYFNSGLSDIEIVGELGIVKEVALPDGSTVSLNEGAVITYPASFNGNIRKVRLIGEAFFNVYRNPEVPFEVHTNNTNIRVLGTSFNVNATDDKVEVVVATGKVELKALEKPAEKIILIKGDKGICSDKRDLIKKKNTDLNYLAWKTHSFVFEETPLMEVLNKIEQVYKIRIRIEQNNITDCKLTATFNNKSIQSVLEIIKQTFDIEIFHENGNYQIKGNGC